TAARAAARPGAARAARALRSVVRPAARTAERREHAFPSSLARRPFCRQLAPAELAVHRRADAGGNETARVSAGEARAHVRGDWAYAGAPPGSASPPRGPQA